MHTTNYFNAFIEVADDCPVTEAEIPSNKSDKKTAAVQQFEMIAHSPYKFTSDDVLFAVFAHKNKLSATSKQERERFFSKGQACLRASPLGKRYGWGFHFDEQGRVAMHALESADYQQFKQDKNLEHTKAMRSKRAK